MLLIGHMTKSKGRTVEATIYGASVLQNMSKGLYVFGRVPDVPVPADGDDGENLPPNPAEIAARFVLACERTGRGQKPPSRLFERHTVKLPGYRAELPALEYLEPSDYDAWQVMGFSKTASDSSLADKGKTELAGLIVWTAANGRVAAVGRAGYLRRAPRVLVTAVIFCWVYWSATELLGNYSAPARNQK